MITQFGIGLFVSVAAPVMSDERFVDIKPHEAPHNVKRVGRVMASARPEICLM